MSKHDEEVRLSKEFKGGFFDLPPGTQLVISGETYISMKENYSFGIISQSLFNVRTGTIHHATELFNSWLGFEQVRKCIVDNYWRQT